MKPLGRLALLAVVFAVGCTDFAPTDPVPAGPVPGFGISDGAHSDGINQSNDDFFFLPPLVKEPTDVPTYQDDPFHATIGPHVEICLLLADLSACQGPPIRTFATSDLTISSEAYSVNWDTKEFALETSRIYRISIFVRSTRVGYADVDPVDSGRELRNVNTNEYIGLVDGRTLPIRFRIEQGALCQVDPCTELVISNSTGGLVEAADGGAALSIPAGALPVDDALFTVERKPVPPGALCESSLAVTGIVMLQYEGCYRITSDPDFEPFGGFTQDVIVGLCVAPNIPEEILRHLQIIKFDEDKGAQRLESTAANFLDCSDFVPTPAPDPGPILMLDRTLRGFGMLASGVGRLLAPRPLFAIDGGLGGIIRAGDDLSTFFWGLPVTASVSAGDGQTAPVGTSVEISPAVLIMTAHADAQEENGPVAQAPVTFTVTGGGGTLRDGSGGAHASVSVFSSAAGIATLPTGWSWELGTTAGANTLQASGPFDNGPVTFTATAVDDEGPVILLNALEYPSGLAIRNGIVYLTETAGRNTSFGGRIRLLRHQPATGATTVLVDDPVNSDALVAPGDTIYLTSYVSTIPGESGRLSMVYFDPGQEAWVETHLANLAIAARDMDLDPNGDIYLIGASDAAGASSLYWLPNPDYASNATVIRTGLGRAWSLARIGGVTYYSNILSREIRRWDGEVDQQVAGNVDVHSMDSDGTWLYYAEWAQDRISRRHLSTGAVEVVLDGLRHPNTVRYDAQSGRLYYLEGGTETAQYKDGRLGYVEIVPPIVIP